MPSLTWVAMKFQKPPLSLKQFMLRSEVLKLYRNFLRLGRALDTQSGPESTKSYQSSSLAGARQESKIASRESRHPLQEEWITWVRSEFRLRQSTTDEEIIRMMLAHGKRQLQEMERTISLAINKNLPSDSAHKIKAGLSPNANCRDNSTPLNNSR